MGKTVNITKGEALSVKIGKKGKGAFPWKKKKQTLLTIQQNNLFGGRAYTKDFEYLNQGQ